MIPTTVSNQRLAETCQSLASKYGLNDRVALVQLPQFMMGSFNVSIARKKGYYVFPPAGLMYLSEAIKHRGLSVRIIDVNLLLLKRAQDQEVSATFFLDILKEELDSFDPSIVGVSCMYDTGIQSLMATLDFLKKEGKRIVVSGGMIPSFEYQRFLQQELCHFVIRGEGENKLNMLLDFLYNKETKNIPYKDVFFKHKDKVLETEGEHDHNSFVDTDMVDSYKLIDLRDYQEAGSLNPFSRMAGLNDKFFMTIQRNRGCRASCSFCAVREFMGPTVRTRPLHLVLKEMDYLINHEGVSHFEWLDDDLLYDKDEFKSMLREIIARGWKITWSAYNGLIVAFIDEELLDLLERSGCIGFKLGIESGNAEMLKKIRKPGTLDIYRKVAKWYPKYPKIFVGGNFMLGFPHEKFRQMLDTLRLYIDLRLDWASFLIVQKIRGASAFEEFKDYFTSQIESKGTNTPNFIPTRGTSDGKLNEEEDIRRGPDVLNIDPDSECSEDQIKEIWFTFNLVGNFIFHKNLMPGGTPKKFISWIEVAQIGYPINPYMQIFLSLAYTLEGQTQKAQEIFLLARKVVEKDAYWQERFSSFHLNTLLEDFPTSTPEVYKALERIQEHFEQYSPLKEKILEEEEWKTRWSAPCA